MIIQKSGFLQRVRTVLTALVVIAGVGTTLMAMKPADKLAAYTYGVADYSPTQWRIVRNVTTGDPDSYACLINPDNTCVIRTNSVLSNNALINKNSPSITSTQPGDFVNQ